MSVPNFVLNAAYKQVGKFVGGPLGGAIGAFTATTAFATEEMFELASKINEGRASFHDIWRAATAIEASLYAYGIVGGTLGIIASPSVFVGGVVLAAGVFATYYKNPTASLDALEALFNGIGEGNQPWNIASSVMTA